MHEILNCDRCGKQIVCMVNSYSKCQCTDVHFSAGEVAYVSSMYEGCLCVNCLRALQLEYRSLVQQKAGAANDKETVQGQDI